MHEKVWKSFNDYQDSGVRVPQLAQLFKRRNYHPASFFFECPVMTTTSNLPTSPWWKEYCRYQSGAQSVDSAVLPWRQQCSRQEQGHAGAEWNGQQALFGASLPWEGKIAMSKENFSLRNFPLTLDAMGELGLDMKPFATAIGSAYAIMHWAANITGDNVKFVLGTSISKTENDIQHRAVHMYLLDFGQCDEVNMDEDQDDLFQALKGSMALEQNQLYLPHPKHSPALYEAWKTAYLELNQ
jgi:hypothetical protein